MSEQECEMFLDNLISFIEEKKIVHSNFTYKDTFDFDENCFNYTFEHDKEKLNIWREFIKGKTLDDLNEELAKNIGTTPVVSGFYAFPNLLRGIKFEMNAFCGLHKDHSLSNQVNLVSKFFKKMPWIFLIADYLDQNDDFHIYEKIENTVYGARYTEFKESIQKKWN